MSEPVLSLVLLTLFFALITATSWFRTLDGSVWREARNPLIAGGVSGVIIVLASDAVPEFMTAGVLLTLAALYVRLTGSESEPADGMTLGAMTGAAAAVPLVLAGRGGELLRLSECILAGAVAGYGITFGLTHVRARLRQAGVDALTACAAIGAAWAPSVLARATRLSERHLAFATVALVPLLLVITVFQQWPSVRSELRDESALGFIDPDDIRPTAHPFLRLGRAGWHDADAHRQFVRIANRIALRKRQQRHRTEEAARLYQLEVIKLRMELQEMARIDRAMRVHAEAKQVAR